MTKRRRFLLAGFAFVLFALIPGSAAANTITGGHDGGCGDGYDTSEAPASY